MRPSISSRDSLRTSPKPSLKLTLKSLPSAGQESVKAARAPRARRGGRDVANPVAPVWVVSDPGTRDSYESCPPGVDPPVWLAKIARKHRVYQRSERRVG